MLENLRFDAVALGEMLIDFTENGVTNQGNPMFEANPGGAPCNVLAMMQKLGRKTAFIGKVGSDMFGVQLRAAGEDAGICMDHLCVDQKVHTTLAFVKTLPGGDRTFSFCRNPGADMMLTPEEVPEKLIQNARIFHYGTLSLTHDPVRSATQKAVTLARKAGAILSFDPNLRLPLWEDPKEAKRQIAWGLAQCDVLKIADDELEFVTGETEFDRGVASLQKQYPNIRMINVTAGANGSYSYDSGTKVFQPAFQLGGVIETTGAGDTFCACVLNFVLDHGMDDLSQDDRSQMLRFANAAAYLVTTRKGAIRSMPNLCDIEALL